MTGRPTSFISVFIFAALNRDELCQTSLTTGSQGGWCFSTGQV